MGAGMVPVMLSGVVGKNALTTSKWRAWQPRIDFACGVTVGGI